MLLIVLLINRNRSTRILLSANTKRCGTPLDSAAPCLIKVRGMEEFG
jgi:hypothetical protein